ncbi:hypothetical protein ACGFNV_02165 [Streptomyces sp. NPDC048751]|uniref:hypothetical protein n=1 Tax=Streptomyces sp. NPDC048751 TaxID=3365591 RepID=UPI0037189529
MALLAHHPDGPGGLATALIIRRRVLRGEHPTAPVATTVATEATGRPAPTTYEE